MDLAPFTPYSSNPTPDSRRAITRQVMSDTQELTEHLIDGLLQIVAMEGPVLSTRAFKLYAQKGGMGKLTSVAKRRFSEALKKARVEGKVMMERDPSAEGIIALLWLPSMQRVIVREYGNRGFDDIPASELGEVMFEVAAEFGDDKSVLYQKMAELYGLKQVQKKATSRLDLVYKEYLGS